MIDPGLASVCEVCSAPSVVTVGGHGMCIDHAEVVMKRLLTVVRDLDATRMDRQERSG